MLENNSREKCFSSKFGVSGKKGKRKKKKEPRRVTFSVSVIVLMKIKYISDKNMSLAQVIDFTCTYRLGPMIWRHKWK